MSLKKRFGDAISRRAFMVRLITEDFVLFLERINFVWKLSLGKVNRDF